MKPLNLSMFLLGLMLAFVPMSYALEASCYDSWDGPYHNYPCAVKSYGTEEYTTTGSYTDGGYLGCNSSSFRFETSTTRTYLTMITAGLYMTCAEAFPDLPAYNTDGTPATSDPSTCSDGEKSEGEEGIDCGGNCSAECSAECPDGTVSAIVNTPESSSVECYDYAPANIVGVCPDGYSSVDSVHGDCEKQVEPVLAAAGVTIPAVPDPVAKTVLTDADLSTTTATYDHQATPDGGAIDTEVITEVTDFADGTTKTVETTITTTTNPDGSSSTSSATSVTLTNSDGTAGENTTTEVVTDYDSEGNVIASTTAVSESTSGDGSVSDPSAETDLESLFDADPGDYLPDSYDDTVTFDDSFDISPGDYGESPDWETLKDDLDPLLNEIDAVADSTLQLDSPSCVLDIPTMYGRSDLQFSFCEYASFFQTAGVFLVAFVYVLGVIFLFERG